MPFDDIEKSYPPNEFEMFLPISFRQMSHLLKNVTPNYAVLISHNLQMADPFVDWTQTILNWVTFSRAARDAGMEGVIYDGEEYN